MCHAIYRVKPITIYPVCLSPLPSFGKILWVLHTKSRERERESKTMGSFLSAQPKPPNPKPAAPLFVYTLSISVLSIPPLKLNLMHLSSFSLWNLYLRTNTIFLCSFRALWYDISVQVSRLLALWAVTFCSSYLNSIAWGMFCIHYFFFK